MGTAETSKALAGAYDLVYQQQLDAQFERLLLGTSTGDADSGKAQRTAGTTSASDVSFEDDGDEDEEDVDDVTSDEFEDASSELAVSSASASSQRRQTTATAASVDVEVRQLEAVFKVRARLLIGTPHPC